MPAATCAGLCLGVPAWILGVPGQPESNFDVKAFDSAEVSYVAIDADPRHHVCRRGERLFCRVQERPLRLIAGRIAEFLARGLPFRHDW